MEVRRLLSGGFDLYPLPANDLNPKYAVVDGHDGDLYFSDQVYGIGRVTPAGVVTFPDPSVGPVSGLTVDKAGNLWFTAGASLGEIAPDGTVTTLPIPGGASDDAVGAITAAAAGNLWYFEASGDVGERHADGTFSTTTLPNASANFTGNQSMAVTPDGSVWVSVYPSTLSEDAQGAHYGVSGAVDQVRPDGTVVPYTLTSTYDEKIGLTAGPDGNVWFADQGDDTVGSITPAGEVTAYPVAGRVSSITTGPDGALWFTIRYAYPDVATDAAAIGRITTAGVATYYAPPLSTAPATT